MAFLTSLIAATAGMKTYTAAAILVAKAGYDIYVGDYASAVPLIGQALGLVGLRSAMPPKVPAPAAPAASAYMPRGR